MSQYTSLGDKLFETLKEAQQKCVALPFNDCGGITWIPDGIPNIKSGYQPRRENTPKSSSRGEVSYVRPSGM